MFSLALSSLTFPSLAFAFLNPILLWGVVLASIPVILHILYQCRYREVEWAAMQFLLQAVEKNSRRIQLEQLLLLAVRTLILVLLAFALAQPFFNLFNGNEAANQPTMRIIVIDTSYSMGQRRGQFMLLDKAKSIANQIAETTLPGDSLQLVRISAVGPRAIVQQPAHQADQVLHEIEQLALTQDWGDLPATLQAVAEMIQKKEKLVRTEIYFISDFQRESWLPASNNLQQKIRQQIQQLAKSASVVFVDLGSSAVPNISISNLSAKEPFLSTTHPIHLQATLRNNRNNKAKAITISLLVDGRLWKTKKVDLESKVSTRVDFEVTFNKPGEHFAEVRLPDDLLLIDNHRFVSLPVKKELRILLVNGRPAGEPRETASYFLAKALSPSTSEETWSGFTRPFVISEGELPSTELGLYDTVILSDIGQLTKRETNMLEEYAQSGGSVIFTLGQNVKSSSYNQFLYRQGTGILPAKLGNNVGDPDRPQKSFQFDPLDLSHPIVKPFAGNPGTGFEATLIYRYIKTTLPADSKTKVVLRFTNGDAAILDTAFGRGRVLLVTTSVDTRWGLWAVQRSFPPMMHELVHYSVAGQWQKRGSLVNTPLTELFPASGVSLAVNVTTPDKQMVKVASQKIERSTGISFYETQQSGIYQLEFEAPLNQTKLFAVNVNPRESQLEKISKKEMRQTLLTDQTFHYMTEWKKILDVTGSVNQYNGRITQWLLMAVLCLLFIEQLMAWRFYWGFLLLYSVVSACFAQQVLSQNLLAGVAATLLFGCGFVILLLHPRREEGL